MVARPNQTIVGRVAVWYTTVIINSRETIATTRLGQIIEAVCCCTGVRIWRSDMEFSPPYLHSGLYNIETRRLIEASNRSTVAMIFQRRAERQKVQERLAKIKVMHDSGIHYPGYCPYCPANVYYD